MGAGVHRVAGGGGGGGGGGWTIWQVRGWASGGVLSLYIFSASGQVCEGWLSEFASERVSQRVIDESASDRRVIGE